MFRQYPGWMVQGPCPPRLFFFFYLELLRVKQKRLKKCPSLKDLREAVKMFLTSCLNIRAKEQSD